VVLFGGRSSEHAISCVTAGGVLAALDRTRFDVVPVGITPTGAWVLAADDPDRLAIRDGRLPAVDPSGTPVAVRPDPARPQDTFVTADPTPIQLGPVDVVLPLLHGPFGEDGTVQGLLEMTGLRYVGSGVLASAVAMDKHMMKSVLTAAGLPVCRWVRFHAQEWAADPESVTGRITALGLPVFVKPARAGSSMGISRVESLDDLPAAVAAAAAHDPWILAEERVVGREVECGVLEGVAGRSPEASVAGEIRVGGEHAFYDFEAKYLDEAAVALEVPATLPTAVADEVRGLAVAAFQALGCEGLGRVDFFVQEDGSVVVNEVNTMPGFTPTSMFPRLWAASGIDYPALVERLLTTALARPLGLR
jgi:D-alanine-D-alanine ligase